MRYREPEHGHAARYGWARVHVAAATTRKAAGKGRDGGYLREYTPLVQWRRKHPA